VLFVSIKQIEKEFVRQKAFVFDSDDTGPVIGQNHRAVRSGKQPGEIDYGYTGQCTGV
jgi:hypothetical protein